MCTIVFEWKLKEGRKEGKNNIAVNIHDTHICIRPEKYSIFNDGTSLVVSSLKLCNKRNVSYI